MNIITRDRVLEALGKIIAPAHKRDIVSLGWVNGVVVRGDRVGFSLECDPSQMQDAETLRASAEHAVRILPGVAHVTAVLTAQREEASVAPPKPAPRAPAVYNTTPLPGVTHIIAIASGKGGVGKSTTAVHLAVALQQLGYRTGLLDADIYGPSLPRMMQLSGQPEVRDGKLIPPVQYGIPCLSMGLLIPGDGPVVWRGSMVTKTLHQFLRGTDWGTLNVLLVDMPPGTGDIHLSLAQNVPLSGAVIVSTPQDVALIDAVKCLQTFQKLNVPLLGIIENMSYFIDPLSGNRSYIFGEGGARRAAAQYHVPFLGDVPLDMSIREGSDNGTPLLRQQPDHAQSKQYLAMAQALATRLSLTQAA